VLTLRFHSDGGPGDVHWADPYRLPRALYEIRDDRGNRVLVLTGTGDRFMTGFPLDAVGIGDDPVLGYQRAGVPARGAGCCGALGLARSGAVDSALG
jgi:hypothetical protein